jgi:hypothetical protein
MQSVAACRAQQATVHAADTTAATDTTAKEQGSANGGVAVTASAQPVQKVSASSTQRLA